MLRVSLSFSLRLVFSLLLLLLLLLAGMNAGHSCANSLAVPKAENTSVPNTSAPGCELQQGPQRERSSAHSRELNLSQLLAGETKRIKPAYGKPICPRNFPVPAEAIGGKAPNMPFLAAHIRPSLSTLHVRLQI
jgi:hypothetical protein